MLLSVIQHFLIQFKQFFHEIFIEKRLVQLLDRNWQTGKYEMKIEKFRARLEQHCIESDDDYILCHFPRSFILIDRRTMKRSQVKYF